MTHVTVRVRTTGKVITVACFSQADIDSVLGMGELVSLVVDVPAAGRAADADTRR